jgi:DHA3 family tetracycline resistance protein-like MFS transporter
VVTFGVGVAAAVLMPETGFRPRASETGQQARALLATVQSGARLIRGHRVLLLLCATTFFAGAAAEGFDRLWEAHFLRDVGLPTLGGLDQLWWFAVLAAGCTAAGFLASTFLVGPLTRASQETMAGLLFASTGIQTAALVAFGLAGSFAAGLAAFWIAVLARSIVYPVSMTWLNQSVEDSSVRATVISITSQSGAIGEVAGGPGVGAIGNAFSLRAALVAAGLLLTPAVALYARAFRHHGSEPELESLPAATEA